MNDYCLSPSEQCLAISLREEAKFRWDDDDVRFYSLLFDMTRVSNLLKLIIMVKWYWNWYIHILLHIVSCRCCIYPMFNLFNQLLFLLNLLGVIVHFLLYLDKVWTAIINRNQRNCFTSVLITTTLFQIQAGGGFVFWLCASSIVYSELLSCEDC
jgi:hypothetical protein